MILLGRERPSGEGLRVDQRKITGLGLRNCDERERLGRMAVSGGGLAQTFRTRAFLIYVAMADGATFPAASSRVQLATKGSAVDVRYARA